jgi:hypothetical protein
MSARGAQVLPPPPPRGGVRRFFEERGAVLIVALLVCALIAIGLASYLSLNLSSSRMSKRTFHGFAALNLAEAGTEEAVWSFNRTSAGDAAAWNQWTRSGPAAWQRFNGFDLGANSAGWVKVYVDNVQPPSNAAPRIVAQSSIESPGAPAATRMVEVTLRRRSSFAGGLVARDKIVFLGSNASVDSWNSDPDGNPATPPVDYNPTTNRADRGTVGSVSDASTAVQINQADIWGFVSTGGSQPVVATNGSIRGTNTPVGVEVDPNRISTDFNAQFPLVPMPADGTPLAAVPATLGTVGTTTRWRATQLSLSGQQTLTILGDVTLILTLSSGADALSVTGNASIIIPAGSKLTVYAEGNIKIAGNGIANGNIQPNTCVFWGTNDTAGGQSLHIAGNGALRCLVYAPHGDVAVNGNGDVMGSVVARNITLAGNAAFHYDESLAIGHSNEPFTIAKWRELSTGAERAPYLPLFQGW